MLNDECGRSSLHFSSKRAEASCARHAVPVLECPTAKPHDSFLAAKITAILLVESASVGGLRKTAYVPRTRADCRPPRRHSPGPGPAPVHVFADVVRDPRMRRML